MAFLTPRFEPRKNHRGLLENHGRMKGGCFQLLRLECDLVVGHLPSMHEIQGLIPGTAKNNNKSHRVFCPLLQQPHKMNIAGSAHRRGNSDFISSLTVVGNGFNKCRESVLGEAERWPGAGCVCVNVTIYVQECVPALEIHKDPAACRSSLALSSCVASADLCPSLSCHFFF